MSHATVEITHSFDLGGLGRLSKLLRDVASATALPLDHASLTHLHHVSKMISHEAMIVGTGSMKRLDLSEISEFGRAVAASVDIAGRAHAHAVAANRSAERHAIFER